MKRYKKFVKKKKFLNIIYIIFFQNIEKAYYIIENILSGSNSTRYVSRLYHRRHRQPRAVA